MYSRCLCHLKKVSWNEKAYQKKRNEDPRDELRAHYFNKHPIEDSKKDPITENPKKNPYTEDPCTKDLIEDPKKDTLIEDPEEDLLN